MTELPSSEVEVLKHDLEEARKALKEYQASANSKVKAVKQQLRDAKLKATRLIQEKVAEADRENQILRSRLEERSRDLVAAQRKLNSLEDVVAEADVVKSQLTASKDMLKDMSSKREADRILVDDLQTRLNKEVAFNKRNAELLLEREQERDKYCKEVRELKQLLKVEKESFEVLRGSSVGVAREAGSGSRKENGTLLGKCDIGVTLNHEESSKELKTSDNCSASCAARENVTRTRQNFDRSNEAVHQIIQRHRSTQSMRMAKELTIAQLCVAELSSRMGEEAVDPGVTSSSSASELQLRNESRYSPGHGTQQYDGQHSVKGIFGGAEGAVVPGTKGEDGTSSRLDRTENGTYRANLEIERYVEELEVLRKVRRDLESKIRELEYQAKQSNEGEHSPDAQEGSQASSLPGSKQSSASAGEVKDSQLSSRELQLKVEELEQSLRNKQSEIGKVRDKARAYLKELNAEKRDMEKRLKSEMVALKAAVEKQEAEKATVEQKCLEAEKELNGCLEVIAEKQRNVQSLRMLLTSERTLREEAVNKEIHIRRDFDAYKGRAKAALDERDKVISEGRRSTEIATKDLREQLARSITELEILKSALQDSRNRDSELSELAQRANKAEAALELLRSELITSRAAAADAEELRRAQGRIAELETDLVNERRSAQGAESASASTLVRLEVAERALKASETKHEQEKAIAERRIEELKLQIVSLEKALARTKESAKSAQRTAAAAAEAMTVDDITSSRIKETKRNDSEPVAQGSNVSQKTDDERFSKKESGADDQIAILFAQIAELSSTVKDAEEEIIAREGQVGLLKSEVRDLETKLAAAERLQNKAPYQYLKNVVVRYLETGDSTLLPVLAKILGLSKQEADQIMGSTQRTGQITSSASTFFSIPFLGGR